jgi:hypothetical protein
VQIERVPGGGIQPQAAIDADGVVHVVYFKGPAASGDLFYVRRAVNGRYSQPLRVNSQQRSAIAVGSVRGAQLAVGRGGRVHVIWNGSTTATPQVKGGLPLFYSRLATGADAFEPQRNLVTWSSAVDGGGTLAADDTGRVFVAWHANPGPGGDSRRAVYLTSSSDDGTQFAKERRVSPEALGACACCSMRAWLGKGSLYLLYRAAGGDVNRDMTLLTSTDGGVTFAASLMHPWRINACPMSSSAVAQGPNGVTAAWETAGQVFFERVAASNVRGGAPHAAPGNSRTRKHPVLAFNSRGDLMLAWLEGTAWARGGSVALQVYDSAGKATSERGSAPGVPVWGLAATAPLRDGRFLLLY